MTTKPPNGESDDQKKPSLRQKLHAATGDREAEAEALAEQSRGVDVDAAKTAVQKAHGDRQSSEATDSDNDIASPSDAEESAGERSP